ncbi:hypothetical protein PspLS_11422 [Pyricularia sp. CBS 133598]|nr:hypothetical protein PspLS_11422 [Pyricularia sp. CBS 133598]
MRHDEAEIEAALTEQKMTEEGLGRYAQVSSTIEQAMLSAENAKPSYHPSAHEHIRSGLGSVGVSLQAQVLALKQHGSRIKLQLEKLRDKVKDIAVQIESLKATETAIRQCMAVVSNANKTTQDKTLDISAGGTIAGNFIVTDLVRFSTGNAHVDRQRDENFQITIFKALGRRNHPPRNEDFELRYGRGRPLSSSNE